MHAYTANRLGDPTPKMNGRLTLNPLVHVDWIGLLMVILLGFGWAKPVRINPNNFANRRKATTIVSIAGPLANLALAFVTYAFIYFGSTMLIQNEVVFNMVYSLLNINLMLFAFNIIPIPPLDGYSVLENNIHYTKYQRLAQLRQYGFMILIVLSILGVLGMYISFASSAVLWVFNLIFRGVSLLTGFITGI